MPYIPSDKPIKIYVGEYLVDPKNGDYDTLGIMYCSWPDGSEYRIDRYFKEVENMQENILTLVTCHGTQRTVVNAIRVE